MYLLNKESEDCSWNEWPLVLQDNSFKPKRATVSPFLSLSDLIAPEIIPIELKSAMILRIQM